MKRNILSNKSAVLTAKAKCVVSIAHREQQSETVLTTHLHVSPLIRHSFLTSGEFSQAIHVNPVFDSASSAPSFNFDLNLPKRPPSQSSNHNSSSRSSANTSLKHGGALMMKASPRSQQLQARYQKTPQAAPSSVRSLGGTSLDVDSASKRVLSPEFPLLFDTLSRTLCVEPDQNTSFLQPSNRIASNYTPTACLLVMLKAAMDAGSSTSKAAVAGIAIYEEALSPGRRPTSSTNNNNNSNPLPRTMEPGTLWLDMAPGSPGRMRKLETIRPPGLHGYSDSEPLGVLKTSTEQSQAHHAKSEERYFAYISGDEALIERRWLAPITSELIDRIVASSVKYLTEPPSGHMVQILSAAQREFVANYYVSAKKALLDYILLREGSRLRLGIPHGTPTHARLPVHWTWGNSMGNNGSLQDLKLLASRLIVKEKQMTIKGLSSRAREKKNPLRTGGHSHHQDSKTRRRQRVKLKLSTTYMLSDVLVRTLQALWHDLEPSLLLVKLPSVEMLSSSITPLDLHAFESEQLRHATQVKAMLMKNWYRRAKNMVEESVKAETFAVTTSAAAVEHRTRHLFDAIATLMSLQLRALVVKSVQAYVAFFELFGKVPTTATESDGQPQMNGHEMPNYSGLLIALTMQNGDVQFRDSLVDVPSHLLSVLHNLPQLFYNVTRIETQFDEPLQFSPPSAPFLWNVTSQEDALVLATIRIRKIGELNLGHLRQLQSDYGVFAKMHRRVCSINTQELAERSDIMTCWAEMESVRATAERITSETHDRFYLRLFCVDCRHVNATILSGLARWVNQLLLAFQEHTSRRNAELRHEYKDVAARLAKKPMDLYELVDAEEFVNFLKTTKISELHQQADAIKARIQFLLFERGNVRIDTPVGVVKSLSGGNGESESPLSAALQGGLDLFRLSTDLLLSTAKTLKWRGHITKLLQDAEASLVNERARIETIFLAKRTRFQAEIEDFDGEVKGFAKKGDLRHAATYVVQLAKMKDALFSFRKTMDAIVEEETKLQWKPTDFSKLDDIAEEMEPYEQLWKTAREFREMSSRWIRGNVFELEPSEGLGTLHQMLAIVSNVSKLLHLNSAAAAITAEMVKKQIADFRENARLVGAILNPSMQERHLKEIAALIGVPLDPQEPVTLLKLLENGTFDHLAAILEISQNASQEKQVEHALAQIATEWDTVQFAFKPLKMPRSDDSGGVSLDPASSEVSEPLMLEPSTLLLRSCVEEIHRVVEENQTRLQSLLCMHHALPFAAEIASWLQFTQQVRRLVDALTEVQRVWKALRPLFAANVVDANSKESRLFSTADELYRNVVLKLQRQPLCHEVISRVAPNSGKTDSGTLTVADTMLTDLKTCLELLEEAREDLRLGLDGKRQSFARFFFLSDHELVGALSCRNSAGEVLLEARELWEYLAPCFPGVHGVQVNAVKEITAVVSSAGEHFPIGAPIATVNSSMAIWLGKLETSMATILQASIRASVSDASRKEFRKWCLLWSEQVLLVAVQHMWTLQCELANHCRTHEERLGAWEALAESLREKHSSLVKELKAATHAHVKLSLANVLLLLRHLQDVSNAVLQELRTCIHSVKMSDESAIQPNEPTSAATSAVDSEVAFESLTWLAQPRYYYESNTFTVKLMTAAPLAYGFEYLGNRSPTFFLTPLTLRCFQAMAQAAFVLNRGTCLEGAAGAGKTSLTQAFATTCGRLFARIDCANALSFESVLQFIKGAAACGAWLAMTNFQLLARHQVSLVGYLCAHVMDTLAAKQSQCSLLGHRVRIKRGCHYVALLQGTAGSSVRSQADPLVAAEARFFFKSVVVQSPDIEVITERLLQQGSFIHTLALAKLVFVVLSAFEHGFALIHGDNKYRVEAMNTMFLNLRCVKRVVRHAVGLKARDEAVGLDATTDIAPRRLGPRNAAVTSASHHHDAHEMEKLEYKLICLALREELNRVTPSAHLDVIEFLLRDFTANSLTRELRVTKSFLPTPRIVSVATAGSSLSSHQQRAEQPQLQLEDAIEGLVRTKDPAWLVFGFAFGQKVVQLLHTMQVHARGAVVVSGDVQSGKTALYRALARSLSQLAAEHSYDAVLRPGDACSEETQSPLKIVASTRCVVLAPRALTLEHLLGTIAEHFADTLLANVIRDAKRCYRQSQTQTWLVFDGDLDVLWSEKLLYLVDTELPSPLSSPSNDQSGHQRQHKGLQLRSGKHVMLPQCVRLVMETTVLADVSPSFLTRVGIVNLGKTATHDWRGLYAAWKKLHEAEFGSLYDEIVEILDILLDETLDASLEFVARNFQNGLPQLHLTRVKALLALFYSSIRQSWGKLTTMVSGKQRNTAIHCFYLQAIVWGVGGTCEPQERQLFHDFIRHLIIYGPHAAQSSLKRVLVLFFPSGTTGTGQTSSSGGANSSQPDATLLTNRGQASTTAMTTKHSLYAFGFSVEYGLKWVRWTEYYELWLQAQASLSAPGDTRGGGSSDPYGGGDSIASLTSLVVPSGSMAAAICLTNQLLVVNYLVLLEGLSDSGKSICASTWMMLSSAFSKAQMLADAAMQPTIGGGDRDANSDAASGSSSRFQRVFVGSSTSSTQVFEQIVMLLERRVNRIRPREMDTEGSYDTAIGNSDGHYRPRTQDAAAASQASRSKLSFAFIDDLHCLDPHRRTDSALELLRMLVEQRQVVHLKTNQVFTCRNLVPFAASRASHPHQQQGLTRVTSRFVSVTLPPLTDADLSSICLAIASPAFDATSSSSLAPPPGSEGPFGGSISGLQEEYQLVSIVIKASIKLFRFLVGEFSLYAAKTSFNAQKLYYNFRVHGVFEVVRSVCCDSKASLTFTEKASLARLWCHESARTLGDRLTDPKELSVFYQHARDIALSAFSLATEAFFPSSLESATVKSNTLNHVWLANHLHFTFIGESSGAGFMDGYREVTEMPKVELSIERSMTAMYRANMGTESLEVVICDYVIQHVLRLTRLLRMSGQHVLLIGSQGKKMATITRLAAFICKKTTVLYRVPGLSDSEPLDGNEDGRAKWQRELKSAVMRSVRKKDEHVVFVFKDATLLSTSSTEKEDHSYDYHYDAIERLVSGNKLLSECLAYEDLDDQILAVLRDQARQEQEASRNSSGGRKGIVTSDPLSSKAAVLEYFYAQVRAKFQLVVILSEPSRCWEPCPRWRDTMKDSGRLAQVLWRTPQLLRHCAINCFGEWPESSLVAVALKSFSMSGDVEKERACQLAQVAAQLYLCTQRCLRSQVTQEEGCDDEGTQPGKQLRLSWFDQVPALQLDLGLLLDQVGLFLKFARRLNREISANKDKYQSGLAFLDRTEQILVSEQAQTEFLQPEMRKRTEMTRRMSGTLEKEKLTSDKLNRALELAINLTEVQKERLTNVEAEYHELVKDSMGVFRAMQRKISVFQVAKAEESEDNTSKPQSLTTGVIEVPTLSESPGDGGGLGDTVVGSVDTALPSGASSEANADEGQAQANDQEQEQEHENPERELKQHRRALIKSFAAIKPVPTALKQLAECLGLIFGIQPVPARDELDPDEVFMDYWEAMTSHMKDKSFWEDLLSYDVEACVNDKVLAQILPICTSPGFEKGMFTSLHELAGFLCEWVQAWASFAKDIVLAGPKFAQLMQEREAFTSAQNDVRARRREIQVQETTNMKVNALRHVSELERQEIEGRLQDNVSTLQMVGSVWKVLASSRKVWRERYEYFTAFSAQWMGDLMLSTSALAYASATSGAFRAYLRTQWAIELRKQCLIHSPDRQLHETFLIDSVTLSRWHLDGLPRGDASAIENATIVSTCFRFPVLIDPHGMATKWLMKRQCDDAGNNRPKMLSCAGIGSRTGNKAAQVLWKAIEAAAKKQTTLVLSDFDDESAFVLRSLLDAKRRALFEAANRDLSSVGVTVSVSSSSTGGGATNYPCWFHVPGSMTTTTTTIEFGSEAWRIYFVYSKTGGVPNWLLAYASQLSLVHFDLSTKFVETQCQLKIVESYGEQHRLTEIQTLQLDILSCHEQVDAIEHELLDFFSLEVPEHMYADVSKALRVIGNRSAMHTLENSKTESQTKILANIALLSRHQGLIKRGVDLALAWRDMSFIVQGEMVQSPDVAALSWVWTLLPRSLEHCDPQRSLQEMTRAYTDSVRSYVAAGLSDENQVLWDFVLAMRLHERVLRSAAPVGGGSNSTDSAEDKDSDPLVKNSDLMIHRDSELVYRTLQVFQCEDDSQLRALCGSSVSTKLVALRPEVIAPLRWRAVCYLAEASVELHAFIVQHHGEQQRHKQPTSVGAPGVPDDWTELAGFDLVRAQNGVRPLPQLSALVRLCVISAVHKELLMAEVEYFIASELVGETGAETTTEALASEWISHDEAGDDAEFVSAAPHTKEVEGCGGPELRSKTTQVCQELFDLWHNFSIPHVPIVVTCAPGVNFLHQVERVALKAKMTIAPQLFQDVTLSSSSVSRGSEHDDALERKLLAAMQKGHWVVLPDLHAMPRHQKRLQRLYEELDEQQLHADYRLWVSYLRVSHPSEGGDQLSAATMVAINKLAVFKQQSGGALTLKKSLVHTFSVLEQDPVCRALLLVPGYEKVLKRLGLLHTVLSTRDHFGVAHWKVSGTDFGDGDLDAMSRTLGLLDPSSTNGDAAGLRSDQLLKALRVAAVNVYGSSLQSDHDRMLLDCCLDLILPLPREDEESSRLVAASQTTIPEIVVMAERLDRLSWDTTFVAQLLQLWLREEIGPDVSSLSTSKRPLHDPFRVRSRRQREFVNHLAQLFEESGWASPVSFKAAAGQAQLSTVASPLEALLKFALELESLAVDETELAARAPNEYKKPLMQLVRHELLFLNSVRVVVLRDIRRIQAVRNSTLSLLGSLNFVASMLIY